MERFTAKPTASIPEACDSWSETCAAYRFLANEDVSWEAILAPHWERTRERMQAHPVVLCIQDTTELDFNGQEAEGLGPLNYEARRGMYLHPTYAVTPTREPLGVLDAWMWARAKRGKDGVRPGQKESARWIEGYERVAEMAATLPGTRLVYVADREADVVALMRRARDLDTPADWLVRATHNRSVDDGDKAVGAHLQRHGPGGNQLHHAGPRRSEGACCAPTTVCPAGRDCRRQRWAPGRDLRGGARSGRAGRQRAGRMAPADQSAHRDGRASRRIDRVVQGALGDRDTPSIKPL